MHTDHRPAWTALRRLARRWGALAGVVGLGLAGVSAQVAGAPKAVVPWPWELRFSHIKAALNLSYECTQVRRAVDKEGNRIGLVEHLRHITGTDGAEKFEMTLSRVEGRSIAPGELQRRQSQYARYQGALYYYQGFQLVDPVRAAENYRLLYLGEAIRAGRAAFRVAVVPVEGDRSAWVLDIDWETGFPLYRAEHDTVGTQVGELEVTSFRLATPDNPVTGTWWTPRMGVVEYAEARACLDALDSPQAVMPLPTWLPRGYSFAAARSVTNLLNGECTAVLDFSDGIDQISVLQTRLVGDGTLRAGDNYLRFEEAGVTQLMFVQGQLRVLVIGRASLLASLQSLALTAYSGMVR